MVSYLTVHGSSDCVGGHEKKKNNAMLLNASLGVFDFRNTFAADGDTFDGGLGVLSSLSCSYEVLNRRSVEEPWCQCTWAIVKGVRLRLFICLSSCGRQHCVYSCSMGKGWQQTVTVLKLENSYCSILGWIVRTYKNLSCLLVNWDAAFFLKRFVVTICSPRWMFRAVSPTGTLQVAWETHVCWTRLMATFRNIFYRFQNRRDFSNFHG